MLDQPVRSGDVTKHCDNDENVYTIAPQGLKLARMSYDIVSVYTIHIMTKLPIGLHQILSYPLFTSPSRSPIGGVQFSFKLSELKL